MTPVSEVTARVLRLNASERVIERQLRQLVGETSQPRISCTKPLPGKQVCWSLGLSGSRGCAYSVGLGTAFIPHSLATVNLCGEALFIAKANRELLRRAPGFTWMNRQSTRSSSGPREITSGRWRFLKARPIRYIPRRSRRKRHWT